LVKIAPQTTLPPSKFSASPGAAAVNLVSGYVTERQIRQESGEVLHSLLIANDKEAILTEGHWKVPLSDLVVDDELVDAVHEAVTSGWWSMGPRVAEFERAFADFTGAKHALAVANGTAALHMALLAVGCGPGDEVILPSLNFVAAANTILHTGATPVFCDVRGEADLNLDPADLEAAVTPATKVLLPLHYGGYACDMDAVLELAERQGLRVVEDAAHAPGATFGGRSCGTLGEVGCFSFFSNKNMPIGEGGMVVTDDDALAERLRLLRSHGMTTLTWDRHRGHAHSYDVVEHGFNYRLDEMRAAVGLVQLRRLPGENDARRRISASYRAALDGRKGLSMPFGDDMAREASSHHLAVALLPSESDRAQVRTTLTEAGIQTSVHYPPIHRFTRYAELGARRPLPRTDEVAERLVTLPLYGHMRDEDVERVASALLDAI
jgi:dTDP-4-amino-4,6-dideoxygalactose transaminase